MSENILVANPRKLRSLLLSLIFALFEALGLSLYFLLKIDSPVTNGEKIFQTALICFVLILTLFMGFSFVCCLRSLYPRAILTVSSEKIMLEKKREILISELESVSVVKNGKKLIIKSKNGEVITLNKGDVNIPLETLEYAINLRFKKFQSVK